MSFYDSIRTKYQKLLAGTNDRRVVLITSENRGQLIIFKHAKRTMKFISISLRDGALAEIVCNHSSLKVCAVQYETQ